MRLVESVWDYPRPPRVEADDRLIVVECDGVRIAATTEAVRVLETSHPPVFYLPADSVDTALLVPNRHRSFCEFKGSTHYWSLVSPRVIDRVAWSYPSPAPGYEVLRHRIAFYPSKVSCWVDGEPVLAQVGGFYGGWITSEITGPYKGGPGTHGW